MSHEALRAAVVEMIKAAEEHRAALRPLYMQGSDMQLDRLKRAIARHNKALAELGLALERETQ